MTEDVHSFPDKNEAGFRSQPLSYHRSVNFYFTDVSEPSHVIVSEGEVAFALLHG